MVFSPPVSCLFFFLCINTFSYLVYLNIATPELGSGWLMQLVTVSWAFGWEMRSLWKFLCGSSMYCKTIISWWTHLRHMPQLMDLKLRSLFNISADLRRVQWSRYRIMIRITLLMLPTQVWKALYSIKMTTFHYLKYHHWL